MSDATTLTDLRSPYISVFVPDMWVAKTKISSVAHLWLRVRGIAVWSGATAPHGAVVS
jgi:hypothetical protein